MRRTLVTRLGFIVFAAALGLVGTVRPALAAGRDAEKGAKVYAAQKCSMCHSIAGKGGKSSPLDGVGKKLSAGDIRAWIATPIEAAAKAKSTKKPLMPAKYGTLPAADLDGLVAYMQSLK